jgi:hypothetical protein
LLWVNETIAALLADKKIEKIPHRVSFFLALASATGSISHSLLNYLTPVG